MASMTFCVNLTSCNDDDDDDDNKTTNTVTENNGKEDGEKALEAVISAIGTFDTSSANSNLSKIYEVLATDNGEQLASYIKLYQESTDQSYKDAFVAVLVEEGGFDEDLVNQILSLDLSTSDNNETTDADTTGTAATLDATADGKTLADSYKTVVDKYYEYNANYLQLAADADAVAAVQQVQAIAKKYQESDDETYKQTLIEEVELLTGESADKFEGILNTDASGSYIQFISGAAAYLLS